MTDPTNLDHCRQSDIECIEAIKAALGPDGFRAYCRGQAIKCLWSAERKGQAIEDYREAQWYCDRLVIDALLE